MTKSTEIIVRKDTYRHKGMRVRLAEKLQDAGIMDEKVLHAIMTVPRHFFFFDKAFVEKAYLNNAFPIGEEQTISQPYTVAYQSEILQIEAGDRVLEVGTGSAYQAAILATMGAKVYSIERNQKLHSKAKRLLQELQYEDDVTAIFGDGYEGAPAFAPFDKVIVTAAAPKIPKKLIEQLRVGGLMVIPVGEDGQIMQKITKISETEYTVEEKGKFRFVPMLKGTK
ncbi:MAG: protein-L-isoaspartate(D-aspartate) O-methyltransferase [Chitinophagales bacterium]